jgi:hypothetical protein
MGRDRNADTPPYSVAVGVRSPAGAKAEAGLEHDDVGQRLQRARRAGRGGGVAEPASSDNDHHADLFRYARHARHRN